MKEIQDDIWKYANKNTIVCILTNDTINRAGKNPMGAGIALEALSRNPTLDELMVDAILSGHRLLTTDCISNAILYRFSTKKEVWLDADLDTIENSLRDLKTYIDDNKTMTVLLPRPGCGCGGLDWDTQVKPLVEKYFKNYTNVYIFSK